MKTKEARTALQHSVLLSASLPFPGVPLRSILLRAATGPTLDKQALPTPRYYVPKADGPPVLSSAQPVSCLLSSVSLAFSPPDPNHCRSRITDIVSSLRDTSAAAAQSLYRRTLLAGRVPPAATVIYDTVLFFARFALGFKITFSRISGRAPPILGAWLGRHTATL